jgi:hypothetical protein
MKDTKEELTLKDLQEQLPWTIKYSRDFRENPQEHKDFAHALTHAVKACGKLAGIIDDLDHRRESLELRDKSYENYIADLVICALRMANTSMSPFDLQAKVINRIEVKNQIQLKRS